MRQSKAIVHDKIGLQEVGNRRNLFWPTPFSLVQFLK
jgi:hypothetical protein